MRIRVKLFAVLRERAGTDHVVVDLPEPARPRDVCDLLLAKYPQLHGVIGSAAVAVNQSYATLDDMLAENDEVAFLPPVSGG